MRRVTGFRTYAQLQDDWCWAAASQMMQHRFLDNRIGQCEIVSQYVGNDVNCCLTPIPEACLIRGPLLLPGLLYNSTGTGKFMTWGQVEAEINANRPFVIGGDMHYYVCMGYDDSGGGKTLLLWDPLPVGRGMEVPKTMQEYEGWSTSQTYYNFRKR